MKRSASEKLRSLNFNSIQSAPRLSTAALLFWGRFSPNSEKLALNQFISYKGKQMMAALLELRWREILCIFALMSSCAASALAADAQASKSPSSTTASKLDDGSGAFATGHYRNLFVENGHSQKEIDGKIEAAYQQLFHGDPQTQAVFFPAGKNGNGPLAYLTDWANHDARTEGVSYGMMISVQLDHKAEFDALWNWAMTYMYIN